MKGKTIMAGGVLLCLASLSLAVNKPNFSGRWAMDKDKSFSTMGVLDQTMTVTQDGDKITMDAWLKVQARTPTPDATTEQKVNETYTLDGQEVDYAPPATAPAGSKGKRKASWLPGGNGIMVVDTVTVNGEVVNQTTKKWTLSSDGKVLRVDYFLDMKQGQFEAKRVFNKTS